MVDGGARVAEVLLAHDVPALFALCGGHISPILVESKRRGIRVVDVRHEVNAVFAADATSRLTGVPGVAAVTAGPGVTNAVTALENARLAQSPLVLLGGATATMLRGRGALQDIDQMAAVHPHVKWSAKARRLADVGPLVAEAFRVCREGLPGPVFVELPVDLLYDEATVRSWYAKQTDRPARNMKDRLLSLYVKGHLTFLFAAAGDGHAQTPERVDIVRTPEDSVKAATEALRASERPLLVLGSQAARHPSRAGELVHAVETLGLPTYLSGMARGLLGKGHPLHRRHKRRDAMKEADLVLLAGVPCDFRLDYGAHVGKATLVSANLSSQDLTQNRKPDVAALGDPHDFLVRLAGRVGEAARPAWSSTLRQRDEAREQAIDTAVTSSSAGIDPVRLFRTLDTLLSENSLLVGDGGDFVATAAYTLEPRGPHSWLDPGVFGTLGVGGGFALAARLARPDADVWLLYGDGAAGFSIAEIDTFVRHGLGVVILVGNDAGWTQIARDQVDILGDDVGCRLLPTAYHEVARGWGGEGLYLDEPERTEDTLRAARSLARKGRPVVVNIRLAASDFRKGSISI